MQASKLKLLRHMDKKDCGIVKPTLYLTEQKSNRKIFKVTVFLPKEEKIFIALSENSLLPHPFPSQLLKYFYFMTRRTQRHSL